MHGISTTYIDQATCCLSLHKPEDICGRKNCAAPCLKTESSIIELDSDLKNYNISQNDKVFPFFIETSGSGTLSFRQACSVESLAFHNKNLKVNLLF
jgi:lactosylceramide 4-alpha-galactosyltransferase